MSDSEAIFITTEPYDEAKEAGLFSRFEYTNTIHPQGTFRAWEHIASAAKWLRIHNKMEWPGYYTEANMRDLKKFFDHYLKGEDNDWPATPRVRYSRGRERVRALPHPPLEAGTT